MLFFIFWIILWLGPGAATAITLGNNWFWSGLVALLADLFVLGYTHRGHLFHRQGAP